MKVYEWARSFSFNFLTPGFKPAVFLRTALDEDLPENAHELVSGRLFVSLTNVTKARNVLVSQFTSKADLLDVSAYLVIQLICAWYYTI